MQHKALAGVLVFLLIATVFLGSAQGGAAGTRLIFPDLIQAPSVDVGYAVLNPLSEATEVTFTAYGLGGALLDGPGVTNPVTLDVGPRSQLARFPADIFGFALDSEVSGWMEVTSDSEEIKGFFITLEDGLDRIDGADATTKTSTSFILMFPPDADPAAGIIHLVNPGDAAANIIVELFSGDGAMLDDADRVISAHGKVQAAPADLVAEIANNENVYLKVTSDQPIAAYQSFRVGDSIAGLNGIVAGEVDVLYSPQLGTGPIINSLLQLVNTGNGSETLTLTARDETGALLADTGLSPQGAASNPRQVVLASGELFQSDMATFFGIPVDQLRSGWIEVRHQNDEAISVVGSILFGDSAGGVFNASLPLQSVPKLIHLYSHVADGTFGTITWFTGLATLNTTDQDANVSVTVRDPAGMVTANGGYLLRAGERVSKTLREILPGFGPQAGGSIEVVSDLEIFSFSLFALSDLSVLAAIPTQPFESITLLDGTEPVGGIVQESVIRIPAGVVLNPDGPLELIGNQSVIIDGDIVSASSVTIRSPGGTVLIGGQIDTTSANGPADVIGFRSGHKPLGNQGSESTDITIEAGTVTFASGSTINDPGSIEGPDDVDGAPQLVTGDSQQIGGAAGTITVNAHVILLLQDLLFFETGGGGPGAGAVKANLVIPGGPGGGVEVLTDLFLKANPDREAFFTLKTGRGGADPLTFPPQGVSNEAHGAPGGNGGPIVFGIAQGVNVDHLLFKTGQGRDGQDAEGVASGNLPAGSGAPAGFSQEDALAVGGAGGNGGSLEVTSPFAQPGPSSVAPDVNLVVVPGDGAPGGDACAFPASGVDGTNGGNGMAEGARGGKQGEASTGGDLFEVNGKPETSEDNPPDGGWAYVGRGNGGHSNTPGKPGGNGGTMKATAGRAGANHADPGSVTVVDAANGGNGYNGCLADPDQPGSAGGNGGPVDITGKDNVVILSANGGNGGRGNPGGPGGTKGKLTNQGLAGVQYMQGTEEEPKDGEKGPDDCPSGLPIQSDEFQRLLSNDPSQVLKFIMRSGRLVQFSFLINHLSASVGLLNKDTGKIEVFSVFDPDFPENPPYNAKGERVLDPGRYCVSLVVSVAGLSYRAIVGEFEVPEEGSPTAQFYNGKGKVIEGEDDVIVVELDLTECCDLPGPLFDVSGSVDNPTAGFLVNSIQFFDPQQELFGGGFLDFPESPAAPLGLIAGGSQGTYTSMLPDGTYDVRIRGNPTDARSRLLQTFAGAITVSEGPVEMDFQLPQLFPLDVTVTADDFRSIFFRQGGTEVQGLNPEVSTLVPSGAHEVEIRRRVREEGTNFVVGELSWNPGQVVLSSPDGAAPTGGNSLDYTFPDAPPFVDVTIFVQDELGIGIGNVIVSYSSGPLAEAPDMTFFGVRRTEEDGFLDIPMPAGTYEFFLEIP